MALNVSKLGMSIRPPSYPSLDMFTSISKLGLLGQPLSNPWLDIASSVSKLGMNLQPLSNPWLDIASSVSKLELLGQTSNPWLDIASNMSKFGLLVQPPSNPFQALFDATTSHSIFIDKSLISLTQSLSDAKIRENQRKTPRRVKKVNQIAVATEAIGVIAGLRNEKSLQNAAIEFEKQLKQKPILIQFTKIIQQSKQDILNQKASFDARNEVIEKILDFLNQRQEAFRRIDKNALIGVIALILGIYGYFITKDSLKQTEIQTSATLLPESSARIISRNAVVKSKPGSGDTVSVLHSGMEVRVINSEGNYAHVIFVDSVSVSGEKGWVSRSALRLKKPSK